MLLLCLQSLPQIISCSDGVCWRLHLSVCLPVLQAEPGTEYFYVNANFIICAAVLEKVRQQPAGRGMIVLSASTGDTRNHHVHIIRLFTSGM